MYTILDCYTDEAAGLGVPPYLGTYPRYVAGYLKKVKKADATYLTIDDLRFYKKYDSKIKVPTTKQKSDIFTYNLTKNAQRIGAILKETKILIVILGVHVPGKYLSAMPGTLNEVTKLIQDINAEKILTGPAIFGTQLHGGKITEKVDPEVFQKVDPTLYSFPYDKTAEYAIAGATILNQIPDLRMIEIETGKGCDIGKCSFCTEPLKNKVEFRNNKDVLEEIKTLYTLGARYFRLGKQTCFYTLPKAPELLKQIREACPDLIVLHIDNCNPVKVVQDHKKNDDKITKAIVKYCTSGNIAAFGIESFDLKVVRSNMLNTIPNIGYEAIKIINKLGSKRGEDGLPKFIPGVNIIFGLKDESKQTHVENMKWLKKIYDEGLMLRRINIRQVAIFEGTKLFETKDKFIRKNKKYYWKWRNDIRQNIDHPMLKRIAPINTIMKNCYAEIYDGKTTFLRQFGTYPLIIGVKKRVPLKKFYNVKVKGHMLRSLVGEIVSN
ncbi:MAG: radical SAM protein [Nanoarchaeota archaeon]|nr:radical SAM protein [Nanoarchaeota archaeon]